MKTIQHLSLGPSELPGALIAALRDAGADVAFYRYTAPVDVAAHGSGTLLVRFGTAGWDLFSLNHGPSASPIAMVARHPDRELASSLDQLEQWSTLPNTQGLCSAARAAGFK